MDSISSSKDEKHRRIMVVCIQIAVIVAAVIVGGLLAYMLILSFPRLVEPFAPPKNLGGYDVAALPRTASLTCYKNKSSVSAYVYGDVSGRGNRAEDEDNALAGVIFLHSEKLSFAVVHTRGGDTQVFIKGEDGYVFVAHSSEKLKGLEEEFSRSFGVLGSCYRNLGVF